MKRTASVSHTDGWQIKGKAYMKCSVPWRTVACVCAYIWHEHHCHLKYTFNHNFQPYLLMPFPQTSKCRHQFGFCSYRNTARWAVLQPNYWTPVMNPASKSLRSFPFATLTQNRHQLGPLSIFIQATKQLLHIVQHSFNQFFFLLFVTFTSWSINEPFPEWCGRIAI